MWKDKKVIMLPTKEKSNLILEESHLVYCKEPRLAVINGAHNYHLYIISPDEEIKEGDWSLYEYSKVRLIDDLVMNGDHKIIATNDNSIVFNQKDFPVTVPIFPQISQQFIEEYISEYNKGNVIEDVEVEYEEFWEDEFDGNEFVLRPCKVKLKISKDNFISLRRKETKLYTREELVTKCLKMQHDYPKFVKKSYYTPNLREIAEWTDNWLMKNL